MNGDINWSGIASALQEFVNAVQRVSFFDTYSANSTNGISETAYPTNYLEQLPTDVRESITTDYYEPGMISIAQRYFDGMINSGNENRFRNIIEGLYHLAGCKKLHALEANIVLIISQLPYIGYWEENIAITATRSPYLDVQESGIRCFERWGNKEACEFLKTKKFEEDWLQEYADEVCANILEGCDDTVLFEKDIVPWEMATERGDRQSDIEGYSSRYSDSRA